MIGCSEELGRNKNGEKRKNYNKDIDIKLIKKTSYLLNKASPVYLPIVLII